MNRLSVGIAIIVTLAASATAGAQTRPGPDGPAGFLAGADQNGDGVVTRAEFDADIRARFDQIDANHDGRIGEGEGAGGRPPGPAPSDGPPPGGATRAEFEARTAEMFARIDANSDGVINQSELANGRPPPR